MIKNAWALFFNKWQLKPLSLRIFDIYRFVSEWDLKGVAPWCCFDPGREYIKSFQVISFFGFKVIEITFWSACHKSLQIARSVTEYLVFHMALNSLLHRCCIPGIQTNGAYWPSCSIFNNQKDPSKAGSCCVHQYNTYMLVVSSIFFYVPEVCVVVLSCCIAKALMRRRK